MTDWLTDVRQELLAAVDSTLQLLALTAEDARKGGAPPGLLADLDRLRRAGEDFRARVAVLGEQPAPDDPAALERLCSRVRHDLLTPVGQLIGYCELLEEEIDPAWRERLGPDLGQVAAAARRMQARIDDLLYLCAGRPAPGGGAAPARDEPAAPALPPRPDRQPGHILVVDDSELNRHLLDRWLRRQGHTAAFAANGAEALARLAAEPFDLVLLDVVMPEMNGYEALRRLKADPRLRHVPVIMISALSEFDRVARCIEIGAEDYLPKPFEPVLLEARIGASLEKKRLRDREIDYLRQIEREKQRYDELLHVMLPGAIVQELKETGTVRSRRYEGVAVLFADIVGFTPFCDAHPPEEVVAHLQALVREFEAICERWGVQKIKTIGDSFMAAAGLLRPVDNPVRACLRCGVEMVAAAERLPPHWRVRVGIHYGPVVAGLLGSRHDLFDLWGDTVNTASRVEQSGEPGAVTLSAAAWEQVAAEAEGEPRGMVHVKGKGEVEMVRFLRFRKGAAG